MPVRMIQQKCALDDSGERTLEMAVRRMGLSGSGARPGYWKVARTLADLDEKACVSCQTCGGGRAVPESGSQLLELSVVWAGILNSQHRTPGGKTAGAGSALARLPEW